jgi:hypothetical protein
MTTPWTDDYFDDPVMNDLVKNHGGGSPNGSKPSVSTASADESLIREYGLADVPEYLLTDVLNALNRELGRDIAKEAIRRKESGVTENTWIKRELVDTVNGVFDGTIKPPVPSLLQRSDNAYLFYAGMVNSLFGSWGGGKTWAVLILIVQMLATQQHVTYIDFEADEVSIIYRLKDLGATQGQVRKYFHYVHPYAPINDKEYAGLLAQTANDSLIVIDSLGEWLAMHGKDSNSDQDVAAFAQKLLVKMVNNGAALVFLDHTPNDDQNRQNLLRAIGSQRKMAAISGAAYRVGVIEPLARGQVGVLRLTSAKDRHGHWAKGQVVAEIVVDSRRDRIEFEVRPPKALNDAVTDELLLLVWSAGDDGIATADGLPLYVAEQKRLDPGFMADLTKKTVRDVAMRHVRRKLSRWVGAKLVEHRDDHRWYLTVAGVELCENASQADFADGEV